MTNKERAIIVTGAAQGIGYAIAEEFVANGDFVAILDLNEEAAQEAAKKLGNAKGYKVDVASEESVQEAVAQVVADKGTIDVLVNNAGLQHISPVEEFEEKDWDRVVDVILKGTFLMTKHVLPSMQKQEWGRVITISSGHGRRPDKYKSAYVAAKYGQIGFTNTVAMENAQKGITANSILPGPTRTQLIEKQIPELAARDNSTEEEAVQKHLIGGQWLGRLLEPKEIAATAVFLASDGAAAITGEALGVTGGE